MRTRFLATVLSALERFVSFVGLVLCSQHVQGFHTAQLRMTLEDSSRPTSSRRSPSSTSQTAAQVAWWEGRAEESRHWASLWHRLRSHSHLLACNVIDALIALFVSPA